MRKFLARMFDLVLREDYNLLLAEHNNQRAHLETMRARLVEQDKNLASEREERLRLQEMILRSRGFLKEEQSGAESSQPVRLSAEPWAARRRRLEEDDRQRANAQNGEPIARPRTN